MRVVRTWLAVTACSLALAGCGDTTPDPSEETAVDETSSAPSPDPTTPEPSTPPPPSSAVRQSVQDLASSLDLDASDVEVVSVEEVTWRDGSRGCAKPGDSYTQALIDGSRITLRADGRTYEYHSGGSHPPALCEKPTE